ncbi:hypothetical protein BRD00_13305 [Halobacteriales archaeon QS_8_69_26]|nr:MAG: hypothetical protein BRD00_13305 [Halobacteriales archaeon QS_8_69_26]
MVEDRITDGRRIAELLASELEGREGPLSGASVTDAVPDAGPSPDGTRAYDVEYEGTTLATALLLPDRVLLEVRARPDRALEAANELGLRARPKATDPPRTLVFVESGAEVKRASDALATLGSEAADRS